VTKKLFAEFLGTFALVFAGTGALVIDEVSGGAVSHVGVALTFGLIIMTMRMMARTNTTVPSPMYMVAPVV
jgi:glycerol uptake facilitator-like aquaporin